VITLRQIARCAGVSHTTVSMALRNDPVIPIETRRRILEVAHRLGYQRDPRLAELMRHVRLHADSALGGRETIAFVSGRENGGRTEEFAGALSATAAALGYRLDRLSPLSPDGAPGRLPQVLAARGIRGVVMGPLDCPAEVGQALRDFAVVGLGAGDPALRVCRVAYDHFGAVRQAVARLREYGYRRIGLALDADFHAATGGRARAAFLDSAEGIAAHDRIRPFLGPKSAAALSVWLRRERPEAIVVPDADWAAEVARSGRRIPEDLACAVLDDRGEDGRFGGMAPDRPAMARCAIEMLADLLERNLIGPPPAAWVVSVGGVWRDGPGAPCRR
jgi:LacI family transcriptional regulator, galactose operon repressor